MDYNIYIHDKTSSQNKPTQARKGGGINTAAQKQTSSGTTASGGFSLKSLKSGGASKKLLAAGKVGLVIYVIKKAADYTMKAIDTVEPFVTRATGDYRFQVSYGNFKTALNNITNPLGTFISDLTTYQQNHLFNKRQEEERLLLGDSFINSNNRKV